MRRLIKKFGDYRISGEAAEELRRAVGEYSLTLAEAATESAKRDNRRTILERDIRAALLKDRKAGET
jgi:histone H3/H4